jgi:hypothetical protein
MVALPEVFEPAYDLGDHRRHFSAIRVDRQVSHFFVNPLSLLRESFQGLLGAASIEQGSVGFESRSS